MEEFETHSLPESAYRPLNPGEVYRPVVPASANLPEATWRSVLWGLFLCAIFTAASAYSGLKVGQVMEAAIPISILAIGLARAYRRRSSVLENVIITGVGGVSGSVVAGAIFTLPALYILKLDPHPWQTIFICLAGGCLGVLFLIPLRRYFVRDMHGQLPYPEATAITEVLVTGEKGGSQAKLLLQATGISAVYDFFVTTFQVWKEMLDFQFVPFLHTVNEKARILLRFDAIAFILGLGYVMGLRASTLLCAGGVLSNLVLVPLIWFIGQHFPDTAVYPATVPIAKMTANEIFRNYVRFMGVGAIATAGIFGIVKSLRVVIGSFSIAAKAFRQGDHAGLERTDRDMSIGKILIGVIVSTLAVAIFLGNLGATAVVALIGLALTLVFSFFFTSVAANAIATTSRNPVSGMTMLTIIISSVVLLEFGVSGRTGMFFVMAIAGMVCTALSVSGQTITDLKTGYWLGSTPGGAGAGQVPRGDLLVGGRRAGDRRAGAGLPVRGGRARRPPSRARVAPGVHHEGARRGVHDAPAGRLRPLRGGGLHRGGHGDAAGAAAHRRPGDVPPARAQHARARRRRDLRTTSRSARSRRAATPAGRCGSAPSSSPPGSWRAARWAGSSARGCASSGGTGRT